MNTTDTGRSVVAGLFQHGAEAEMALTELKKAGYTRAEISEVDQSADARGERETSDVSATATATATAPGMPSARDGSFFHDHEAPASSFLDELLALGFSSGDARGLVDAVVGGQALVTADAGALGTAGAKAILDRHAARIYYARGADGATAAVPATTDAATGDRTLELREERLQLDKQRVQHGEARLSKRVVTEMKTIDVPVSHEELVIERVPVADGRTATGTIGRSEEIVIPLSTEVVNVEKRVVATENVTVGKRQVAGVEHIDETVRREELVIDDASGDAKAAGRAL